jgi:hypothetical protein
MNDLAVRVSVLLVTSPFLAGPLIAQGRTFVRACWQIDEADGGPARCQNLTDRAPDPCYQDVGIHAVRNGNYDLSEATFDIELSALVLSRGVHAITTWFETAQGDRSEESTHLFYVAGPPVAAGGLEMKIDGGPWLPVDAMTDGACPDAPEVSWLIPDAGLQAGEHRLSVRLLGSGGEPVSERGAKFQVSDPGAMDPPTLRPDLPGEVCENNNEDDDRDGLINTEDPECGDPDLGPSLSLVLESVGNGSWYFSLPSPVDGKLYYPAPGDPRAGRSFIVLPVPRERFNPEVHACRVELLTLPPTLANATYDPSIRLAETRWTNRPGGYPGGIDVRFDRGNAPCCPTSPPPLPGTHLADGNTSHLAEMPAAGQFEVSVVGWLNERVGFWSSPPRPLSVLPFCLEGLEVCSAENRSVIRLRWRLTCETEGEIGIFRAESPDSVHATQEPIASVMRTSEDTEDMEYLDPQVQAGVEYTYQVRARAMFPVVGPTASNSASVSLSGQSCEAPQKPTGLAAAPGNGTVEIDWNDNPESDLLGYEVYRDGVEVNLALVVESRYVDGGLTNGTRYCYRVRAVGPGGESPDSDEACATPCTSPTTGFRRGDADVSGAVNINDAIRIMNVLFLGIGVIACDDAADADDSGAVNINDAIRIMNVLFLGIGVIPAPGAGNCGIDPTEDGASCASYSPTC